MRGRLLSAVIVAVLAAAGLAPGAGASHSACGGAIGMGPFGDIRGQSAGPLPGGFWLVVRYLNWDTDNDGIPEHLYSVWLYKESNEMPGPQASRVHSVLGEDGKELGLVDSCAQSDNPDTLIFGAANPIPAD